MVNPISLGLHVLRGKDPVGGKVILIVGNRVFHSANQSTSPPSIRIHKYVTSCETGLDTLRSHSDPFRMSVVHHIRSCRSIGHRPPSSDVCLTLFFPVLQPDENEEEKATTPIKKGRHREKEDFDIWCPTVS